MAYEPVPIGDEDISFVIQGPLGQGIQDTIDSVRLHFPKAEVVLSTWAGEVVDGLRGVDVVLTSQPPAPLIDFDGRSYNLALQMDSTRRGIGASSRPFVYKMRTDHRVSGRGLCLSFMGERGREGGYRSMRGRIVVPSFFTRDVLKLPVLFHLSDLAQFGCREDMMDFWSSPLPSVEDLAQKPRFKLLRNLWGYCGAVLFREAAEQYLVLQWLRRHGRNVRLAHPCAMSHELFVLWERILAANFYVVDAEDSGLVFPPHFLSRSVDRRSLMTNDAFGRLLKAPGSDARFVRALWTRWIAAWFLPRYWLVRGYIVFYGVMRGPAQRLREKVRAREAKG